jgi:hypothetical protein
VSKAATLAKLHTLLERIRVRARASDGDPLPAAAMSTEPVEESPQLTTWTPPPPDEPVQDVGLAIDVEYVETTQVSAVADVPVRGHLDSTARLVAAGSAGAYSLSESRVDGGDDLQAGAGEPGADLPPPHVQEEETADHAPASSRRPVMPEPEDRLEQMAFGSDEAPPPIHTPPPESGRMPAAPSDEFDSEVDELRDGSGHEGPMVVHATRAVLESAAPVATMTGDPSRSTPSTFSALLAETLAL